MTVLGPDAAVKPVRQTPNRIAASSAARPVRVEPLLELEWSRAVEPTGPIGAAVRPAQTRRAWIHRAPENQVLNLYTAVRAVVDEVPAPWWLRALAAGRLRSRIAGFAVEDRVAQVLDDRPGWMYMPWTGPGEDGYWEYVPSETHSRTPTMIVFTDRHPGWLDVIPAHSDRIPEPVAIAGATGLRDRLAELERDI